ncbi:ABC transporter permease [Brevibacillus sp. TJ4]|uniref:ABC transporter permease n=1 Tax=Brevibacillus sp. TJ4 TaxID=3234853 RepID=UPI003BA342DB
MAKKGYYRSWLSVIFLLAIWQFVSWVTESPGKFPPVQQIGADLLSIFLNFDLAKHALATMGRILLGLLFSFVIGTAIGLIMSKSKSFDQYIRPALNLIQGIPALSWVVFAVIWFPQPEFRMFFIIFITALPNFSLQIFDSIQAISKDFREMLLVLRPKPTQMFRMLVLPSLIPDILTSWKVNLGNTTRVAVVAELVGATLGIGFQLQAAQALFEMSQAIAWTFALVIFIFFMQFVIGALERTLLSWRPKSER